MPDYRPHILSEEEIDILLRSDPTAAARMTLLYLNRLVEAHQQAHEILLAHQVKEDEMRKEVEEIGGVEAIRARARCVDSIIARNERWVKMMDTVIAAGVKFALPAFLGFLVMATWHEIVAVLKAALEQLKRGGV